MSTYETLRKEVFDFCNPIITEWSEKHSEMSKQKFQMQYLYSQAVGAFTTFQSYGILRDCRQYRECKILCRTLLERLAKSLYASNSDTNAIERVIYEITSEIRSLRRLEDHSGPSAGSTARISVLETDLGEFKSLMEDEEYDPNKKIYQIFEEAKVDHLYRGSYSKYCESSHGGFLTGIADKPLSKEDDYHSLLSPTVCASILHQVACTDKNCTVTDDAVILIGKIGGLLETGPEPSPK